MFSDLYIIVKQTTNLWQWLCILRDVHAKNVDKVSWVGPWYIPRIMVTYEQSTEVTMDNSH